MWSYEGIPVSSKPHMGDKSEVAGKGLSPYLISLQSQFPAVAGCLVSLKAMSEKETE